MHLAMEDVVKKGTAHNIYTPTYRIAGKTGTAQVKSIAQGKRYNEAALDSRHWDHGWFVGFAPVENPQIAIAVIVENGRHGGWVAPIVRKMMDYWLIDKIKKPIVPPSPEELAKINAEKQAAKLQRAALVLSGKPIISKPNTAKLPAVGGAD